MSTRECSACGYESDTLKDESENFIRIKGNYHREKEHPHPRAMGVDSQEIRILACPKCNTLLFEDKW